MKLLIALLMMVPVFASAATLEEKVEALTAEVANLKEQMSVPDAEPGDDKARAADKVYFSKSPLAIGGYGEIIYRDFEDSNSDEVDALRVITYLGYRFSDKIIFNSEIEVEHADEIFVEMAYLDFLLHENMGVRVGVQLVPMGLTNLEHEPTLFPTVNRSEVEANILPTTWRESGILTHGTFADFEYQAGIIGSFDASGFSDSSWLRGGRQKASKAKARHWSGVARLDYVGTKGLLAGASVFSGANSHGDATRGDADLTIWDVHARYQWMGLQVKALYTQGVLGNSLQISNANGSVVGKKAEGYYVEIQYNIMPMIKAESAEQLNLFVRYDDYDTHKEVDASLTADDSLHRKITTVGLNYMPISNVVLKADYQIRETEAGDAGNIFGLGAGWVF